MYPERITTCQSISTLSIPHGTIASLAQVAGSKVSEFVKGHAVSGQASAKIDKVVADISELVVMMHEHLGLRPDLRDIPSLRVALSELNNVKRQCAEVANELTEATAEASQAFQAAVSV